MVRFRRYGGSRVRRYEDRLFAEDWACRLFSYLRTPVPSYPRILLIIRMVIRVIREIRGKTLHRVEYEGAEQGADAFQADAVGVVEGGQFAAVDVEDTHRLAVVVEDGDDYL